MWTRRCWPPSPRRGCSRRRRWRTRGLLRGRLLQHLNLTEVLHVAGFITVYEAFLGMEPHVDLFRWIFTR